MIDVRIHSSRHLETKITYPIPEHESYDRDVDYYIFTPAQLNVSSDFITNAAMLRKFQAHARYASPEITLDELLDRGNKTSPLVLLEQYTQQRINGPYDVSDTIFIHELQTLGNSFRHESGMILSECKELTAEHKVDELRGLLQDWCKETGEGLRRLRSLMQAIRSHYPGGNRMIDAFEWADEAISLVVEGTSLEMYLSLEPLFNELQETAYSLLKHSRAELSYRRLKKYASVVSKENRYSSEAVAYRSGVLKKWTQSVLYLTPVHSKAPQRVSGILAGTAAAIAMTFATMAAIFAETFFLKNSMQWALLVILAYVFKDRIKEGLRAFFSKVVPRLLADQISSFISPRTGKKLSRTKIIIRIKKASEMPPEIQKKRLEDGNPFQDMLPEEDVVHYTRFVKIYKTEKDRTIGPWINAITVITRIRIDDWLKEMDDPNDIMYVSSDDGDFEQQNSERVYHLHLVITETSKRQGISEISHYRVIMNKTGILRLERVGLR
ncbi:MAG: hypothetical protein WCY74_01715 [Sphaerochaetaceae bacterium]|jgi:hypothetical protein|nr:hypothetical protein [Sphaerochaetaceae bacterium]MDX9938715.1 hypothetical protein [Sphaerochaetaceae bacterium]